MDITIRFIAYPAKIAIQHELMPADSRKRAECQWLRHCTHDDVFMFDMFFSDKIWFHLDDYITMQNYNVWSSENPYIFRTALSYPQKIGISCAIIYTCIGPIFLGTTITAELHSGII